MRDLPQDPPSLCQPDPGKSCGACCGLYNYRGAGRGETAARLGRRTERFGQIDRYTPETLESFSRWVKATEPPGKLLETIYNCEYLGFLDPGQRRVGCLLHPARHKGVEDLRDCSFYGAELCAGHLCLSYSKLSRGEKWCLILSLDDWYLYGICVTDIDLCKRFFSIASDRLGSEPNLSAIARPEARAAAADFFRLKVQWPFRSREEGRFGKYCLAEDEYRQARIPYEEIGCPPNVYDAIFLSLASEFSSSDEVRQASDLVDGRISAFVDACR